MFDDWKATQRPYETKIPQEAEYNSYYSTGTARPRTSRHPGLLVLLTLLVILACCIVTLLISLKIQLNGRDVKTALSASEQTAAPGASGEQTPEIPADDAEESKIAIPAPTLYTNPNATLQIVQAPDTEALSLQQVYQKVIPSVVSIVNTTFSGEATGTGIIMSADGYILTNAHVVQSSAALQVLLQDSSAYDAAIVGSDETSDLAVIKIDASNLTAAEFGDSSTLQVGDEVVAIGDPLGTQLRGTMTNGIVSAINRDLVYDGRKLTLIQTNAALNSGNSGGPLINMHGQVVGINTMKISAAYTSTSVEGLGFAIPTANAKQIVDELMENGYVAGRPAIGVSGEAVPVAAQAYYRLPSGVYIQQIDPNCDAYAHGVREGDIITSINGTPVSGTEEMNALIAQYQAGDQIAITFYHRGSLYQLDITLMDAAGAMQ